MTAGFSPLAWLGPGVAPGIAHGGMNVGGGLSRSTCLIGTVGTPKEEQREVLNNTAHIKQKP